MNRAAALAVVWVALTALVVGPSPAIALVALLLSTLALVVARGAKLERGAELVLSFSAFCITAVVSYNLSPVPAVLGGAPIPHGWSAFGTALLLTAALRLWIAAPQGGVAGTLGFALVSLAVWGGNRSGYWYAASIALFLITAIIALRRADLGRPPLSELGRRHRALFSAALAAGLSCAVVAALTLPPLHSWVVERVMRGLPKKSGFSSFLWLGSMRGMLQSEKVVLRVRGAQTDHLRGIVYVTYTQGAWTRRNAERTVHAVPRELPQSSEITELEVVSDGPRYFTPLSTRELAASTGFVTVDDAGVFEPVAGDPAKRLWFRSNPVRQYPISKPNSKDRSLPYDLVGPLRELALKVTQGAATPDAKMRALELHLRSEYSYSLDFERKDDIDPVLDFLFSNKSGHCEYFATALALLGRSIGIPTRLVAGYTVSEYNALGGYHLVREKNAHSWVEGWSGTEWVTFDATPRTEGFGAPATETSWLPAAVDLLGERWSAFMDWLLERELEEVVSALAAAVALLLIVRLVRLRRTRMQAALTNSAGYAGPLAGWLKLEQALSARKLGRLHAETIERWRARVEPELPRELTPEFETLTEQYAALRYGGIGEPSGLEQALNALAASIRQSGRQEPARPTPKRATPERPSH